MEKLKSRKLVVLVATVLLAVANKKLGLGLDDDTMNKIMIAIGAYLVGQGIADHGGEGKVVLHEHIAQSSIEKKPEPKVLVEGGQ